VYALHLSWETEALIVGILFGAGIALFRIISMSDIKLLLHREKLAEAAITPPAMETGSTS
jgi:hypothetical protein